MSSLVIMMRVDCPYLFDGMDCRETCQWLAEALVKVKELGVDG